jgi:hypothetical protein
LRAHLKMRNSCWDLDNLAKKPRNHIIHNHWKYGITGRSEVLDGVIVDIEQCGETDYSGMIETYSIQEVMKARVWDLEDMLRHVMEYEAETGKQASILYVMDLTGLQYNKRLYQLVTGAMRSLCEFMATHYVELIKYFVLVNVPSCVYALWHVAKPLLPERTRHKVRILGGNWRKDILQYSCPQALPTKWNDSTTAFESHVDPPLSYDPEHYYRNKKSQVRSAPSKLPLHVWYLARGRGKNQNPRGQNGVDQSGTAQGRHALMVDDGGCRPWHGSVLL